MAFYNIQADFGCVSDEDGYQAARLSALNGIAQLQAATGDLEKVRQIVRIEGCVHCASRMRLDYLKECEQELLILQ